LWSPDLSQSGAPIQDLPVGGRISPPDNPQVRAWRSLSPTSVSLARGDDLQFSNAGGVDVLVVCTLFLKVGAVVKRSSFPEKERETPKHSEKNGEEGAQPLVGVRAGVGDRPILTQREGARDLTKVVNELEKKQKCNHNFLSHPGFCSQ